MNSRTSIYKFNVLPIKLSRPITSWHPLTHTSFGISKNGPDTRHTILIIHRENGPLALVVRRHVCKIDHLTKHRLMRTSRRHTLDPFEDQLLDMIRPSIGRGQWCLNFDVLMETEQTDWSTKGAQKMETQINNRRKITFISFTQSARLKMYIALK